MQYIVVFSHCFWYLSAQARFLTLLDAVDEAMALRMLLSPAAQDDTQSTADSDGGALPEFEIFGICNVLASAIC
jgi:hypothetical protein